MAEPPDSSDSVPESLLEDIAEPDAESEQEHDKQGLELAKSLASRLKQQAAKGGIKPVKRRRRPRIDGAQISSARPDDRDPQRLTTTVGRLMRDQGWEVDVAVHGVMARWPTIVGPEMAEHCKPESYDDTVLTVRTSSTAWKVQLDLLVPQLLFRLNAELGDGTVTQVKVLGPNTYTWRKGSRTIRGGRGPRDTYG